MTQDFLPTLPARWQRVPLKYACTLNPEVLPENTREDEEIQYIDISALEAGFAELAPKALTFGEAPSRARRILRGGDTIVSTVRTYLRAVATFPALDGKLVASTGFAVLRPNGRLLPRFAYWATLSEPVIEGVVAHSEGVSYPSISPTVLGTLKVPVPPEVEQERIANFLDEKTARIDALIAEKRRLESLLEEYRKSLVTHAVAVGLRRDVPLRPSGLEWPKRIPTHWPVMPMKHLGEAIIGLTYSPENVVAEGSGILVLRASNVQSGRLAFDDNVYVDVDVPRELITRAGDILICSRSGSRDLIGKSAAIDSASEGYTFGAFMTVFRGPNNGFLKWVLASQLFEQHSASFLTSTINQLTVANLNSLKVPLPPVSEREAISEYLGNQTDQLDALRSHVLAHIERLQEYRTSLISAAVTGTLPDLHAKELP